MSRGPSPMQESIVRGLSRVLWGYIGVIGVIKRLCRSSIGVIGVI